MRVPLDVGTKITLSSYGKTTVREVVITKKIGEGASCIAYEAVGSDSGIPYVLKECCPRQGTIRQGDGATVCWDSEEQKQAAFSRFRRSYEVQFELQQNLSTENTNVPLAEELLFANNTVYSLVNRRNLETYTLAKDETLQQIFITARAIARAVSAYHSAGYLHLDIKPDNIMVYPETRDMILLLDFDSIVEKDKVLSTESLSYSPGFCAPEQAQHRRNRICEATDRFAIGAIVFSRIFDRIPDSTDTGSFSRWDFDDNPYFRSMSRKVMRYTADFLHMTLAASPACRYSSDTELIRALDKLIKLSDPSRNYIVSADIRSANSFVGRKRELDTIRKNLLSDGSNVLVLQGMGGIGKTELAIQAAREIQDIFDTICFGKYRGSLDDLFHDSRFITLSDGSLPDGLTDIKRYLDDRTLLIIDGFDTLNDPQTDDLSNLPCKVMLTSRNDFSDAYPGYTQISISEMSEQDQLSLFMERAGEAVSKDDKEAIADILRSIDGYTLLIPLVAQLLRKGNMPLPVLAQKIQSAGITSIPKDKVRLIKGEQLRDSVIGILQDVLDMSAFSEEEHYVLKTLLLFRDRYIEKAGLLNEIGTEYGDVLNDLVERGWLQQRGSGSDAVFSMHSIVAQVYELDHKPRLSEMKWVLSQCASFIADCDNYTEQIKDGSIQNNVEVVLNDYLDPFHFSEFSDYTGLSQLWQARTSGGLVIKQKSHNVCHLLNSCLCQDEEDIERLISILMEITRHDLSRTLSFTHGTFGIEKYITRISEDRLRADCYYLLFIFSLRDIANHSIVSLSLKSAIAECYQYSRKYYNCACIINDENYCPSTALNNVLTPLFSLGITAGLDLFCHLDSLLDARETIDREAADAFIDAVSIFTDLAKATNTHTQETHIDAQLELFTQNMSDEKYLEYKNSCYFADNEEPDFELPNVTREYAMLIEECHQLVSKCQELGFGDSVLKQYIGRMNVPENQKEVARLLTRLHDVLMAIEAAQAHSVAFSEYLDLVEDNWNKGSYLIALSMLAFTQKENEKARDLYIEYVNDGLLRFHVTPESEVKRLESLTTVGNPSGVKILAQVLIDLFPIYQKIRDGELHPVELELMQDHNLILDSQTLLTLAMMTDNKELITEMTKQLNQVSGTDFIA